MMRIHNNLPFTVASMTMAETFYISPEKRQKSPLKIQHNIAIPLHRTTVTAQRSMTTAIHSTLPRTSIKTAHFKST
jgi:hypothetical protein